MPSASVIPPSAEPVTQSIRGSVSYLNFVGFIGTIEGIRVPPPAEGTACADEPAYRDITTGSAVVIGDGLGATLATIPLTSHGTVTAFRKTAAERQARASLVDTFYDLRISKTLDELEIARLNYERAKQQLYDSNHPDEWTFESHRFYGVWCRFDFVAADLPEAETYTIAVGSRAPLVVTQSDLLAKDGELDLFF